MIHVILNRLGVASVLVASLLMFSETAVAEFEVRVVDAQSKQPVSVRMTVQNARGAIIKQRGVPTHAGSFCFFGKHTFKLPRGVYSYTIEKGLEYRTMTGHFEIKRGATDGVTVELPRFTNMSEKGWWSGDLAVHRPVDDLPVLMDANDLNFAHSICATNQGLNSRQEFPQQLARKVNQRMAYLQTGLLDSRFGGGFIILGSNKLMTLPEPMSILPFSTHGKTQADLMVFANNAANWDLPLVLAEFRDSIPSLHGIALAGDSLTVEQKGKKKRKDLRPPAKQVTGNHKLARWQTAIYYHVLNCGFKIPPVACSGSGKTSNPVGYNRVYVHTGQKFSQQLWLENLKQGRVVVSNGPVMNVLFNGLLPGETIQLATGKTYEVETTLSLSLKEKADYLEIIRNGLVAEKVSLDEYAKARGRLPKIKFSESGWMLVRVVTNNKDAYRFASSGPIYVQIGDAPLLKRESAQFFLDWVLERARMIQKSTAQDKEKVLEAMRPAFEFWKSKVEQAGR